tara:strand:+ start:1250 stop:2209 length:960 start_codon:yes stop_codon:yes gene_type:complete
VLKETESLLALEPDDNNRLANLCGQFDENLRYIEINTSVNIANRGNNFRLSGTPEAVKVTCRILKQLYKITESNNITKREIHLQIQQNQSSNLTDLNENTTAINTRKKNISARSLIQKQYMQAMANKEVCFGIGPAGTGKTYLAVASAVNALETNSVRRVCLVRPAVEAGERLGFLPGDMSQKIDPYLRPLYDALHELMGFERVSKLIERNIIEVAPLAFMRGRSLNESFIILDEAQNTTPEQMKMFLTRIGFGSRAVITGDITQIDLPRGTESGLKHVSRILVDLPEISFNFFSTKDVVRHRLVAEILKAYGKHEKES